MDNYSPNWASLASADTHAFAHRWDWAIRQFAIMDRLLDVEEAMLVGRCEASWVFRLALSQSFVSAGPSACCLDIDLMLTCCLLDSQVNCNLS